MILLCVVTSGPVWTLLARSTSTCLVRVFGVVWYGMVWLPHHTMVQYWYHNILYIVRTDGLVWYFMVHYNYSMEWYGVVWYVMMRYGMVWYGMVC